MITLNSLSTRVLRGTLMCVSAGLLLFAGCGAPVAEFQQNHVFVEKNFDACTPQQRQDLANVMEALFGTPDDPHVPPIASLTQLIDEKKLKMSAGPYGSYEDGRPRGLYREHCVHCHGVTGDGKGPTASFLNPYPRDYRAGIFKFKSTPKGERPTADDLYLILHNGIPGTAMPSFKLLPADELESLIHYVRYLAVRGEVERGLVYVMSDELEEDDRLYDPSDTEANYSELVDSVVSDVASKWNIVDATTLATEQSSVVDPTAIAKLKESMTIPLRPDWDLAESAAIGKQLFYGETAGCVKCHGDSALGDGQMNDFDDWTKEYHDPKNPLDYKKYVYYGALEPRNIIPRNLRKGVYRGGRRPIDIYRRIANGIDGTPMPKAASSLTSDDIWHIVDYVRTLPREPISNPYHDESGVRRERL